MNKGFFKIIILLVIALALLKMVWGFDILEFMKKPEIKGIVDAIIKFFKSIWSYISSLLDRVSK